MSPDPSPRMFWRGIILSLRDETEAEQRYIEGIVFALRLITQDPGRANITEQHLTWIEEAYEQAHDRRAGPQPDRD